LEQSFTARCEQCYLHHLHTIINIYFLIFIMHFFVVTCRVLWHSRKCWWFRTFRTCLCHYLMVFLSSCLNLKLWLTCTYC